MLDTFSMQGAKAIAEMLKKNSTLRVLELNNNMIDYTVRHCVSHFFEDFYRDNVQLQTHVLFLYSLLFVKLEQGFASIAGALLENNAIRSIHIKLVMSYRFLISVHLALVLLHISIIVDQTSTCLWQFFLNVSGGSYLCSFANPCI